MRDRSGFGVGFDYAYEKTHEHFHISSAARYELQPLGGAARVSDKVGFCMFDSDSPAPADYFRYEVQGADGETWCAFDDPDQATVRMGLSPGGADRYSAQREMQWVDITGLEPGPAMVRGQANPLLCVLESDEANNTTSAAREIPGVRVADVAGAAGRADAARARSWRRTCPRGAAAAACRAGRRTVCYVWAAAAGPLTLPGRARAGARGGRAGAGGGRAARRRDLHAGRGLRRRGLLHLHGDRRARPDLLARDGAGERWPRRAPAPPVAAQAVRLSRVRVVRRRGRYRVELRASAPARLSGRLERRRGGKRSGRFGFVRAWCGRAPARMAIGRLAPGRYRLRLYADGKLAATARFTVRRF